MVGHILRYHPAVNRLKELIDSGELGKIQYLYSNRHNIGKIRANVVSLHTDLKELPKLHPLDASRNFRLD